jgi:hypothetical protein
MPDQTATVTGYTALFTADLLERRVSKYADPIDDARTGIDYAEGRRIAAEDPSLIYFHVKVSDGDLAERVRKLRDEAAAAGDAEMVAICDDALIGRSGALAECLSVMAKNNE